MVNEILKKLLSTSASARHEPARRSRVERDTLAARFDPTTSALWLLDQRLLPERGEWIACRTVDEVARAIRDMVVRGAPAIGVTAAYGVALGAARHGDAARRASPPTLRRHAPDGGQPVLGHRAHEAGAARGAGRRRSLAARRERIHAEDIAACLASGDTARRCSPSGARPHPLQRRRAGHRRLRHRARRHPRRRRSAASVLACSPTRPARSCRARASPPGSCTGRGIDVTLITDNMAAPLHAARRDPVGRRRRRPHRRQRRHRQQDRHLRRGACWRARTASRSSSPRRSRRSTSNRRRARRSRSRSATAREVTHVGGRAGRARRHRACATRRSTSRPPR